MQYLSLALAPCAVLAQTQYARIHYFNEPSAAPNTITGWVKVTAGELDLKLEATLYGLDEDTEGGIHIHYGTSCASEATVKGDAPEEASKGHYYDPVGTSSDPWSTVTWASQTLNPNVTDLAFAYVSISRAQLGDIEPSTALNRVVIVHNPYGEKIGCGVLADSMVQRTSIAYFSEPSAAPANIGGVVTVTATEDLIEVTASLTGLESGTEGGIHIHYGTSCASEATVKGDAPAEANKGHFYRQASSLSDPWATKKWQASSSGATAVFTISKAALGVEHTFDVLDRVVIVHNSEGAKIGCGLLSFAAMQITEIAYFEEPSAAPATVNGFVTAAASQDDVTLQWWLMGLDSSTTGGIHIHYGRSCESESSVKGSAPSDANKGHYYVPANMYLQDPWVPVVWSSDSTGKAVGSFVMSKDELGVSDTASVFNRVVIVHNTNGTKIGCGLLSVSISQTAKISYFSAGQASPSSVVGTAVAVATATTLQLTSELEGLERNETGGIHIHYGKTCNSEVTVKGDAPPTANKGHYYVPRDLDNPAPEDDPWGAYYFSDSPNAVWTSNGKGTAETSVTISWTELNAYPWTAFDRVTIVHNSEGGKIGCGVLSTPVNPNCQTCDAPVCAGNAYFDNCEICIYKGGNCSNCGKATCIKYEVDDAVNPMVSTCALIVGICSVFFW